MEIKQQHIRAFESHSGATAKARSGKLADRLDNSIGLFFSLLLTKIPLIGYLISSICVGIVLLWIARGFDEAAVVAAFSASKRYRMKDGNILMVL